jgi:hypothetical protein
MSAELHTQKKRNFGLCSNGARKTALGEEDDDWRGCVQRVRSRAKR